MSINLSLRTNLFTSPNPTLQLPNSIKSKFSLSFPLNSPHTRQEFRDESDINTIMARYLRTGELPHVNTIAPQYFDAAGIDFQTHMQSIADAKSLFAQLPSSVRFRFANDPGLFIDFCGDESNRPELARMGLLSPDAARKALHPTPPKPASAAPPTAPPAAPPASPEPA